MTHVTGKYYHTNKDFLNEGADEILALGSKVIKLWFYGKDYEHPQDVYPFNSEWKKVDSLVEGAKLPYWKSVFDKPFSTYIFCVTSIGRRHDYWVNSISQEEARDEEKQFYELTKHLLTTYKNSSKTFILQHWEGDWMTRPDESTWENEDFNPDQFIFDNMIKWLNARQAGVNRAREEFGQNGVRVFHAAEVNRVVVTMLKGKPTMINKVIPYTNVDLVSYSSYDSIFGTLENNGELFEQAVDFIKQHLPPSAIFGENSVYIGEFGIPENDFTEEQILKVVKNCVKVSLEKNCPYIVYWQLYCNELKENAKTPTESNDDCMGFWLIRADGSKAPAWNYFYDLLNKK